MTITNNPKTCIALGFFDGVHRGHQKVLATTVSLAEQLGLTPAAYLFRRHPSTILHPDADVKLLTGNEDKQQFLESHGIREIIFADADANLLARPGEDFIRDILIKQHRAAAIVCGYDYRFGAKRACDTNDLCHFSQQMGFTVQIVPAERADDKDISSTHIRHLIESGNIQAANALLGRPFSRTGLVSSGRHLGSRHGIPTANQQFTQNLILPQNGVYITRATVSGIPYGAVTNIGRRPTVSNDGTINSETHLIGYNGNLYGREMKLAFFRKLRGEQQFASTDALFAEIRQNIAAAKTYWAEHGPTEHDSSSQL